MNTSTASKSGPARRQALRWLSLVGLAILAPP